MRVFTAVKGSHREGIGICQDWNCHGQDRSAKKKPGVAMAHPGQKSDGLAAHSGSRHLNNAEHL
jgi:hypothetical protein